MIDPNIIAILAGIICVLSGVAIGMPLGHQRFLRDRQRRVEDDRAANREAVKQRALARVENAAATAEQNAKAAVRNPQRYGVLEAEELL